MKCNQCNNEMIEGYIQSGNRIFWGERKHKLLFTPERKGEFFLSEMSLMGSSTKAYRCERCKVIVTPYSEGEYENESS